MFAARLTQTPVADWPYASPRFSRRRSERPLYTRSSFPWRGRRASFPRASEDDYQGPLLEPLDLASTGGLGGTSEDVFGPLAILLVGFSLPEYLQFKKLLEEMEAEFINLIPCPAEYLTSPLESVLFLENAQFEAGPLGLRRTVFLSGMYAAEVQEVVSAYRAAQLPSAVFAAFVPKNKDKRVCDLVEEVYDDHQYMMQQRQSENENPQT